MSDTFAYVLKSSAAQTLGALTGILTKAEQHARSIDVEDEVLLSARLAPDMFPAVRQVQVATDIAVRGSARLAALDMPSFPDTETRFAELIERVKGANTFVQGIDDAALNAGEMRQVDVPTGPDSTMLAEGRFLLTNFILPNLHFHAAMAYGLFRGQGVPLGKRDFLMPG